MFAHSLLLSIRCPLILNLAVSRGNRLVIEMKDVSHNSLLAFLRYIYAGQVDFAKSVTADLLQLARKFNVLQLTLLCEKMLRSFIDDVCYTSSVESVAGDVPKPLDIDDDHLTENDKDNPSVEPYKDDVLSGIKEPLSEKLGSLPGALLLESSHGTVLSFSPGHNDQVIQTAKPSKTIIEDSDMEFSPERQNERNVPISVCNDYSISVIEPAARLDKIPFSSVEAPISQVATYKKSKSTSLELDLEIADKGCPLEIISEQNISSFTQSNAVFQEVLKQKEMPTSFKGVLSGEHLNTISNEADSVSLNMSCSGQDPGFTDIPSGTDSLQNKNQSNNALLPMYCRKEQNNLCKENSVNQNSTLCALSDYEFDNSNELFSESEDFGGESENVGVGTVNSPKFETRIKPMEDSIEISNDSICFVSENQQNIHSPGLTSMALHLADTVCENRTEKDLVSGNTPMKAAYTETLPQVLNSNCNALNGRTASFHMADTILEVSKTIKDSSDSPCIRAGSPLSTSEFEELSKAVTLVQESLSESGMSSTKNLKKFSPSSLLDRFDSSEQNFRTGSDSELDVKEMSCESSRSSKPSLLQLTSDKYDPQVKNL